MNLREAKIHFLEAGRLFDEKSRELVATLGFDLLDGPSFHARPLGTAADHLAGELARMHTIGVVRAVASALDCLAGVVIGVGALKKSILRADFNEVQRNVFRKMKPPTTDGERLQFELAEAIVRVVDQSGPLGWMEWLLDYRNMLVHRGRHVERNLTVESGNIGVSPRRWLPFRLPANVMLLPRDPGRAEVEVLRDMLEVSVLEESAEVTLAGILSSTLKVIAGTCEVLIGVWRQRRAAPEILVQPLEQWKEVSAPRCSMFRGFQPGEYSPLVAGTIAVSPLLFKRMVAASFSGGRIEDGINRWSDLE